MVFSVNLSVWDHNLSVWDHNLSNLVLNLSISLINLSIFNYYKSTISCLTYTTSTFPHSNVQTDKKHSSH